MTIKWDGDVWRLLSVGSSRRDETTGTELTYAHLASTTRGFHQHNGFRPVMIGDWLPTEVLVWSETIPTDGQQRREMRQGE